MRSSQQGHFRASPRPQIASKVTIRKKENGNPIDIVAYTRDIGMGGVFVETAYKFEMGETVDVELATPSMWEPLVLKASVCRVIPGSTSETGGIGLRFENLTNVQVIALSELATSLDFDG